MKLADLGRWGGRLETRDEAKPSVGMFLSRDWLDKWETERCTRL